MAKEEKFFDKKMLIQIGLGVLLYFMLNRDIKLKRKTENKPVAVEGNDNEVTKGVKIEVKDNALIRIDPNVSVSRFFKNGEYFGKGSKEVPRETYENWKGLSEVLTTIRLIFKKPVVIAKGWLSYPDGKGAVIRAQDKDNDGLWNSVGLLLETNRNFAKSVKRLSSGFVEILK